MPPADESQASALPERRAQILERRDRIGEEHDAEAGKDEVECASSEVMALRVALFEAGLGKPRRLEPLAGERKHRARDIDAEHLAAFAHAP